VRAGNEQPANVRLEGALHQANRLWLYQWDSMLRTQEQHAVMQRVELRRFFGVRSHSRWWLYGDARRIQPMLYGNEAASLVSADLERQFEPAAIAVGLRTCCITLTRGGLTHLQATR
jgi:hypothetical protein